MQDVASIARVCHEANRAYCETIGDFSQQSWERAEEWQRESAINGVRVMLDGTAQSPEEQHQAWFDAKARAGWTYGAVKDPDAKKHPCMVAYNDLPDEQKRKDRLFRAVVSALTGAP